MICCPTDPLAKADASAGVPRGAAYNARVIRSLLLAMLFVPAVAIAQPTTDSSGSWSGHWVLTTSDGPALVTTSGTWFYGTNGDWLLVSSSGGVVTGTSGSMAPGMKRGVPGAPRARHPYFFAAYAAVWLALFAYVLWLASRMKGLERRR